MILLRRKQQEMINVPRTKDAKIALIDGKNGLYLIPLCDCHHTSVNKVNTTAVIFFQDLSYTLSVRFRQCT